MALITGTYVTYATIGRREDLEDDIYNISPEETPFSSGIGSKSCSQTFTEWQLDSLATATTANAHLEGDETAFITPTPTVRVGNVTQISKKSVIVSGTDDVVDKAGRESEYQYQITKQGMELRRDCETIYLANQAGNAGAIGTARTLAGMGAWLKTNTSEGAGGVDPTYTSGLPSAARTDGTQRVFTETLLKTVLQGVWVSGGRPSAIMANGFNRTQLSGFPGIATRTFDISRATPTAVIASADVYVSDWGNLRVIPNRFQREREVFILDWKLLKGRLLRPMFVEQLAKTGDAKKGHIIKEYTLQVRNEAGLGAVYDLTTS